MSANEQEPNKIIINSFYKEPSERNDNFTCLLPANVRNIKAVKFQTIAFPNTMKPFKGSQYGATQNNTFTIIDDPTGTPNSQTITIDENAVFPTASDFADYLQDEINAAFSYTTAGPEHYLVTEATRGNYLRIERITAGTQVFTYDSANSTANLKLGITQTTGLTAVSVIQGIDSLFIARTSIVYVHCNIADNDCLTDQQQNRYDIAMSIPINTSYGFIQTFQSSEDRVIKEELNGIQRISIVLRDEEEDLLDLSDRSYVHLELAIDYKDKAEKRNAPAGQALGE